MKSKLVLAVAAALFVLPTKGRADTLTMTELSSQNLSVSLTAFGHTYLTNALFQNNNGGDSWVIPSDQLTPTFIPVDNAAGTVVEDVAWNEPGNSSLFNLLKIHYTGQIDSLSIQMFSDVNTDTLAAYGFYASGGGCITASQAVDCKILDNNTPYDIPIFSNNFSPTSSTLTVNFNDLGDVATPLPSTWLMLLSGFLGLGFLAYRGTKKRTAIAAA
jgi:hypothetical protein